MKRKRYQLLLLLLTITSLILLVAIQIGWVLKSARMQEAQFNHTVTLAMNRIVETLSNNRVICREMNNCLKECKSGSCRHAMRNQAEWSMLDTLIRNDLKYYNINLDYEFDVVEKGSKGLVNSGGQIYKNDNLDRILDKSGYELRLRFPEKSEFIKAQIGYIFISSIALLLLISVSFLMIYRFYKSENRFTRNMIDFINNMTHEFKTPLTNISLANSMISRSGVVERDKKLAAYSKVIKNEHLRLKEKVDVLIKATISENGQPVDNEIFNIAEEIKTVADTFEVQLNEKNGVVLIDTQGNNFNIYGNIEMFQVAIGNLIDNAIRYNNKNPEIKIKIESAKSILTISIADNGIGINKENLNQIFEKFYRVPTGDLHNNDGFGLGLYFVKKAVLQMQGKIRVSSQVGYGTCFTMEFPVSKEV
jgi:two-component system phosphate regulon sensor histidine kinase PhoR